MLRSFVEAIPKERRPIRSLDLVAGDLDDATVYRERDNIDLLIEVPDLKLVVTVENKVGSAASDGQLDRYATRVRQTHQGWRHLFVFLTPDGIDPEHESYVAFSYVQIAKIIEELAESASERREINLLLRHYVETLRRHVVQDENLKRLAVQIYERHKEALDFIFDCRPEPGNLLGTVRDLIGKTPRLALDRQVVSIARFAPEEWTDIGPLNACSRELWTKSGRNVLFEVNSFKTEAYDFSDRILLSLILGPSALAVREHFFSAARANPSLFSGAGTLIGKSWTTLFSKELLTKNAAAGMDDEQKITALTATWNTFVNDELPKLTEALAEFSKQAPVAEPT